MIAVIGRTDWSRFEPDLVEDMARQATAQFMAEPHYPALIAAARAMGRSLEYRVVPEGATRDAAHFTIQCRMGEHYAPSD